MGGRGTGGLGLHGHFLLSYRPIFGLAGPMMLYASLLTACSGILSERGTPRVTCHDFYQLPVSRRLFRGMAAPESAA